MRRATALVRSDRPIAGHHFAVLNRAPRLGEDVAAIGFPLALPLSVTRGSVSGSGRTVPIEGVNRTNLVQTDAAVNPGNSGGPLITSGGNVIGLIDLGTNEANGLAFAVSARVAGPLFQSWRAAPQPISAPSCGVPPVEAAPASTPDTSSTPDGLLTYSGARFSIDYPSNFDVRTAEVDKGGYYDTTIEGGNGYMIRIDEDPSA